MFGGGGGGAIDAEGVPQLLAGEPREGGGSGMGGTQGTGGSTEEVTAGEGGWGTAVGEVDTALGWQSGGRRRWRHGEIARVQPHSYTHTHAWPNAGHIVKGHRSAQAVREAADCLFLFFRL